MKSEISKKTNEKQIDKITLTIKKPSKLQTYLKLIGRHLNLEQLSYYK